MNRSVRVGLLAAAGLSLFYIAVVGGVGGFDHLPRQALADWPWLVLILVGFATQVALYAELRRRHTLAATVRVAAGAGGGASAIGMAACCAHHIADLAPIIGVSGAAVFLTTYRTPIMLTGVLVNAVGVLLGVRRLRRTPNPSSIASLVHR